MYMKPILYTSLLLSVLVFSTCKKKHTESNTKDTAYRRELNITHNGIGVTVVVDKPLNFSGDVLMIYHGTVAYDSLILKAARNTLDSFKKILTRQDMMLVSVAYPEENLLLGDNIAHAEAALLWVKNTASAELGINIRKIFLAGHSQGGYLVTRLNTMHETNGVIANAPGPLNLVFRCQLEEDGKISQGIVCTALKNKYGTTRDNAEAYQARSLLRFTDGYKSDILFVQGLEDSPIQMNSWPTFKQKATDCSTCKQRLFHEVPNAGHGSLFQNSDAQVVFNRFIADR